MNKEDTNLAIKLLGGWYLLTHSGFLMSFVFALPMFGVMEDLGGGVGSTMAMSGFLIMLGFAGAVLYMQHRRAGLWILFTLEILGLVGQLLFYMLGDFNQAVAHYPKALSAAVFASLVAFAFTFLKIGILWTTRVAFKESSPGMDLKKDWLPWG